MHAYFALGIYMEHKHMAQVAELSKATGLKEEVIKKMSPEQREELADKLKAAIAASRVPTVTLTYPVPADMHSFIEVSKDGKQKETDKDQAKAEDHDAEDDEEDEEDIAAQGTFVGLIPPFFWCLARSCGHVQVDIHAFVWK
jgi:hypothetical protein